MEQILIVTGAGRGIGAAVARLAGRRGYAVCVNYLQNHQTGAAVVQAIEHEGGRAFAAQADIAIESGIVRLFEIAD
jgi:NAD(P)-dependent dehydrogenase (short-subunit alcohol dehydrogenase family)